MKTNDSTENYEVTEDGKEILDKKKYIGVQRAMGNNMVSTWQNTPLVSGFLKVDASAVKELKDKLKAEDSNVTYTALFIKLLSTALEKNPSVNAALVDKNIEVYKSINIGFAVGTPDEHLYTPVIRNTEDKNVFEIAKEIKRLTKKVLDNNLTMEDLSGGTITMSSMGMYESWGMTQILVPPQAMILGYGSIRKEPVVLEDDSIGAKPIMYISTTSDHRVLQGEPVAKFSTTLLEHFKTPDKYMGL